MKFQKLKMQLKTKWNDDNILIMKESLNSDGQQFQQNEQLPLILTHWTQT